MSCPPDNRFSETAPFLLQRMSLFMALYGHGAIPDLSPLCEQKRTSARATEIARQMVLDIIGDLLADRRQLKHLVLDDRIVGLLGKLPIHGRLVPEISQANPCRSIPMSWVGKRHNEFTRTPNA
jgi:hypothetical protein